MAALTKFRSYFVRFLDTQGNVRMGEGIPCAVSHPLSIKSAVDFHTGETFEIKKLLPPVEPKQILCVGLNYKDHAEEVGMTPGKSPVVFDKLITSVIGHQDTIIIPKCAQKKPETDYEAELAVVISKPCKDVSVQNALDYVFGYTCANDVSARRWQGKKNGNQWSRCKSFDTFCPVGPWIVSPSIITDPHNLKIQTILNDNIVQNSNTEKMIFNVAQLVSDISQGTTLHPGSLILTGTPAGVGLGRNIFLKDGDNVEISIENIGKLSNPVMHE